MTQEPIATMSAMLPPMQDRRKAVTLFLGAITLLATMDMMVKLASALSRKQMARPTSSGRAKRRSM